MCFWTFLFLRPACAFDQVIHSPSVWHCIYSLFALVSCILSSAAKLSRLQHALCIFNPPCVGALHMTGNNVLLEMRGGPYQCHRVISSETSALIVFFRLVCDTTHDPCPICLYQGNLGANSSSTAWFPDPQPFPFLGLGSAGLRLASEAFLIWQLGAIPPLGEEKVFMSSRISLPAVPLYRWRTSADSGKWWSVKK